MLTQRVIACLDVCDGRVVKGVRFQGLRDAGDPVELAARYEREGADELTLLDVSATTRGRATAADTVASVRRVLGIPLTVGGGIGAIEDAARLLDAGADKVAMNTAATARPELITQVSERFGRQCVVIAIDAARRAGGDGWAVVVRSGTEATARDAVAWAHEAAERGAGEVLLTSWDRDGTGDGYDLPLTSAVAWAVSVPVIASGGAAGPEHLLEAFAAGASAVLAASIFHDSRYSIGAVKAYLAERGLVMRGVAMNEERGR